MSTGTQTQAIPRVPPVDAGPTSETTPPEPVQNDREESVQHLYEAGMAKLHALHDRWAAALADVRETEAPEGSGQAAA